MSPLGLGVGEVSFIDGDTLDSVSGSALGCGSVPMFGDRALGGLSAETQLAVGLAGARMISNLGRLDSEKRKKISQLGEILSSLLHKFISEQHDVIHLI